VAIQPPDRARRHPWQVFLVIAIAVFLTVLDLFIVNLAIPAIATDFPGTPLSTLSWILTAYAIVFAALLVPAGKLGDLFGRRRLFVGGLVVFLAGSALASVAQSVAMLVGARVIQAVGAAAMTPNSLGLVLPIFPPQRRSLVIGLWAAIGAVGAAAGPPLGGLLAEASWRWIFLVNLPLGIVAVVLVPRLIGEIRDDTARRLPDWLGSILLVAAIGLLTLGLSQGPGWGWDARVAGTFLVALILVGVFLWRSSRHPAPVVELPMLAMPNFALAGLATVLFSAAFAALLVSQVFFLTSVWHYSVLEAGFGLIPGPAVAAIFAALAGRLGVRFGSGAVGFVGGLLFATGPIWSFARLTDDPNYLGAFLPSQLIGGAGIGLVLPSFIAIAVAGLQPQRLATGIGVQSMFRQIAIALGVAVWVALLGSSSASSVGAYAPGWTFMALSGVATGFVLLASVRFMPSRAAAPLASRASPASDADRPPEGLQT
jgi:EmrB/QacA subfamily drug resistance transporter